MNLSSSLLRLLRPLVLLQQVHGETHSQGSIPHQNPCSSLPCFEDQQNVVVRRADRLQTGMRGAFGKPQGTVARVRIGQPLMSVRTYDRHKGSVIEALRRTKFKFPGRQKIFVSKKWGFTKFERDEFEEMRASGRVRTDGSHCKYLPEHGPLAAWCKIQAEIAGI